MSERHPLADTTVAEIASTPAPLTTPATGRAAEPMPTETAGPAPGAPAPLRASDADRAATVARLHHALGEGRLDLAETDERVAAAYAARYRSELPPLLADIPDPSGPAGWAQGGPPAWNAIWSALVWRARGIIFPAGSAEPPTDRQCRIAARLALIALVWMTACALLGAALVGA